jgi:hypothetical protein
MGEILDNAPHRPAPELAADEQRRLHALLTSFASPRLAGSEGAQLPARILRERFEELGYQVRELPFSFSAWPARFTVPLLGMSYLALTLSAAGLLLRGRDRVALSALLLAPPLLGAVATFAGALVLILPWGRVHTANWLISPPGGRPQHLVMAHRDSKSQPVSTTIRTTAALAATLAWGTLLGAAAIKSARPRRWRGLVTRLAGSIAALSGATLLRCGIGNESPGALDNASGLAALLGIAERERGQADLAFLVTDGEEHWLAGARHMALIAPRNEGIINLDGLDDRGSFYLIDRRSWPPYSHAPQLAAAIANSAAELGYPIVRRALPLGILVDHIPLARAGHRAVSIMHGSRRSLLRVHRPADHPEHLTAEGVLKTVRLVCHALAGVRRQLPR